MRGGESRRSGELGVSHDATIDCCWVSLGEVAGDQRKLRFKARIGRTRFQSANHGQEVGIGIFLINSRSKAAGAQRRYWLEG